MQAQNLIRKFFKVKRDGSYVPLKDLQIIVDSFEVTGAEVTEGEVEFFDETGAGVAYEKKEDVSATVYERKLLLGSRQSETGWC